MKKFMLIALIMALVFGVMGCDEEDDSSNSGNGGSQDMSIGEITITNLPAKITINQVDKGDTFKIYLNASNSSSQNSSPVAKGVAKLSINGTLDANGNYSVKIKLQNPNSSNDTNPNTNTGDWSGTASFFSVMISPEKLDGDGENAIIVKGGYTLNKGKETCSWDSLIDLRGIGRTSEIKALYDSIIVNDNEITKQ